MNWDDLRFFLAAHRAGSFAGAARELGVEHTTVSRRLAALETALAVRLFTRSTEGLHLTAAGRDLLPSAEQVERLTATAALRAAGEAETVEGTVRVATSEGLTTFFARRLGPLRERYPKLLVDLLTNNRVVDLARGEADFAIRAAADAQPDLLRRKLCVAGWSFYASPAYIARRGDASAGLRGHDIVGFDDALARTPGAEWLATQGADARFVMRGNSLISVVNAAVSGMGLALLPCHLGADTAPALVRATPEVVAARTVWLVVHPDLARVPRVRAVMEFVTDLAKRELADPASPT